MREQNVKIHEPQNGCRGHYRLELPCQPFVIDRPPATLLRLQYKYVINGMVWHCVSSMLWNRRRSRKQTIFHLFSQAPRFRFLYTSKPLEYMQSTHISFRTDITENLNHFHFYFGFLEKRKPIEAGWKLLLFWLESISCFDRNCSGTIDIMKTENLRIGCLDKNHSKTLDFLKNPHTLAFSCR